MITVATTLDPDQRAAVFALLGRVAEADGVAAVGEDGLLALVHPGREERFHLLAREAGAVVGYACADGASAELAVDPAARRHGYGRALLRRLLFDHPGSAVWAHGTLPPAVALARADGLTPARELLRMRAAVAQAAPLPRPAPPTGLTARAFTGSADGRDAAQWLALNSRVFADHPEQGRITAADLGHRLAEPWFDPALFTLVHRGEELVAFGWLKPAGRELEVYVLGVDAGLRRRGIAAYLLAVSFAAAADRGLEELTLYVEGDNGPAVRAYQRSGFELDSVDTQFVLR